MPPVRRIVTALGLAGGLAAALVVGAPGASAESIADYRVDTTVTPDTAIRVVEWIAYDFEGAYRHGIYRDIPRYDETLTGTRRSYDITVNSVTMDGQPVPVEQFEEGPFLRVRVGDPVVTITGEHVYVISYTVADGLRLITEDDVEDPLMPPGIAAGDVELYWDHVGNGWNVPVARAQVRVAGPGDVVSSRCFVGEFGSTAECPVEWDGPRAGLGPVPLAPGQALTGVTVFPAAAFDRPPTENVTQGLPSNPLLGTLLGLLPAGLLIVLPALYASAKREEDRGVDLPASPAQYSPPDGLRPAQMAAAWRGDDASLRSRVLVATLVDLASRRWIDLSTDGGDLSVTWLGTGTDPLADWENELMGAVLKGQPSATLSGYDKGLASVWGSVATTLATEAQGSGRRNPDGDAPDRRWRWLAVVFLVFFGTAIVAVIVGESFVFALAVTIGLGAVVGLITARAITPRKETLQSAEFQARVRGLEKVLGTDAAASRREFAQRLGLPAAAVFATMLPYAIVLDLEDSWMGAFPDLTPAELTSVGFAYVGIASIGDLVRSGTTSASAAMTAPSSGSGGGGFSGGGGDGGGGGSW